MRIENEGWEGEGQVWEDQMEAGGSFGSSGGAPDGGTNGRAKYQIIRELHV